MPRGPLWRVCGLVRGREWGYRAWSPRAAPGEPCGMPHGAAALRWRSEDHLWEVAGVREGTDG